MKEMISFALTGTVTEIGELAHMPRNGVPDLCQKILTIMLMPDNEKPKETLE